MAASKGRKTTSSGRNSRSTSNHKQKNSRQYTEQESAIFHEVTLILLFAAAVILFLCNFGVIGTVGDAISRFLFGMFGYLAYVAALAVFFAAAFWSANAGSPAAVRKLVAGVILFLMAGALCEMLTGNAMKMAGYSFKEIYVYDSTGKTGGGVIAGSLVYLLHSLFDTLGTMIVLIILTLIAVVLLTERSVVNGLKNGCGAVKGRYGEKAGKRQKQTGGYGGSSSEAGGGTPEEGRRTAA